jgi:hypothetical protein
MRKWREKKFTIVSLKFFFWLSMGINAGYIGLVCALLGHGVKSAIIGALVMAAQILHGVRACFFDKTIGNMSASFCVFQFMLMFVMSFGVSGSLGGVYGRLVFFVTLFELLTALIIFNRRRIVEKIKRIFLIR